MFERFTNKARHVVVLSQEEARLLSHNYIGTEHILLGLLGEAEGTAANVLASFGMTRDGVRAEVEEMVGRGKKAPSGHIPFTPRAKKTLELSLREALAIKHDYIGTEHILLGLIREGEGIAAQIMRKHGDLLEIRMAALNAAPPGAAEGSEETNAVLRWLRQRLTGKQPWSGVPRAAGPEAEPGVRGTPALEAALREAASLAGQTPVGSHHLLLAALTDTNSAATWALSQLGVDLGELREKLRSAPVEGTSDEQPEQAGRRQMSIQVTDEILTVVCTDPVLVAAGKNALRAVHARSATVPAAEGSAAEGPAGGSTGQEPAGRTAAAGQPSGEETGTASATATVIRGDLPDAIVLADVWLELRKALNAIADPIAHRRRVVRARKLSYSSWPGEEREPGEKAEPGEKGGPAGERGPDEGEAAGS
jgi:ATP-dependent Clp protease ATP-binding subunit ClpC